MSNNVLKPLSSQLKPSRRRGSMLVEVTASAAMLAALLIVINQVVVQLHRQTRLGDQHLVAQQTLENLLEDALRRPWSALTSDAIDGLELPKIAQEKLLRAVLSGDVSEVKEPVLAKRVTLRLSWENSPGSSRRPLVLTTWVFKLPEGEL